MINESGLVPLGRAVLVRTTELDDIAKASMIAIPQSVKESTAVMEQRAVVIAIGPACWDDEKSGPRCEVGDKVIITKFAGYVTPGRDGKMYRLVNDRDVFCKVED